MSNQKMVEVRALTGFKYDGRVVAGASRDEKGKLTLGEVVEVPRSLAAELVHGGKAEYIGDKPKAEKLSTKSAAALVG
jgi:hypothetical protein